MVEGRWRDRLGAEAADLVPLVGALLIADRVLLPCYVPPWAELALVALGAQTAGWRPPAAAGSWQRFAARLPVVAVVGGAAWALFVLALGLPAYALAFVPIWLALEAAYRVGWARYGGVMTTWALRPGTAQENIRRLAVGAAALFLLRGFLHSTLVGGGDAGWYGTMLADMVAQTRAGIFPVWAGQSIYQFNGAIYPLRVAPAFHHLGALADLLTGRTLGVYALQNLVLTAVGLAAAYAAYFTLAALLPGRRWLAAGLAVLFLACPGVVGLPYISDLFMSWTTVPFVPIVWFATIRSFRDGGPPATLMLLGGALGLCWWGHSPIAIWTTLIASAAQLVRLASGPRSGLRALGAGAFAFLAVAAYPVGSVLLFPPEHSVKAYDFQAATAGNIVYFIRNAFPADLLPLSYFARNLGDLQLGYGLWALLLFTAWSLRRVRAPEARTLLGAAVLLLILLTPVPGLDLALWQAVPRWVRDPTGNWAMNRLYLVLGGLAAYAAAAAAGRGAFDSPGRKRALAALVAAGCLWSLGEAARFARSPVAAARAAASAVDDFRPENVAIIRFSYMVFPHEPAYFTHGVTDPALENRLRRGPDGPVVDGDFQAALAASVPVASASFAPAPGDAALRLPAPFHLEAGQSYLLDFGFPEPTRARGDLLIRGRSLHREYSLPESGEAAAFGAGGRHSPLVPLRTSRPAGEDVTLEWLPPEDLRGRASELAPFARVTLRRYDPGRLPVQVFSWMPYRAHVAAPEAAWLETPRMYQDGYAGWVNGRRVEVRKSAEGLVALPVPAGRSEVKVKYYAPIGLQVLYWLSLVSAAGAAVLAAKTIRQFLRPAAN